MPTKTEAIIKKIIECQHDETVCIRATISSALRKNYIRRNMTVYTVKLSDGTGVIEAVWFNTRFLENQLKVGNEYIFYGKISTTPKKRIQTPVFEKVDAQKQTGRIVPIYPSASGLTQKVISDCVQSVFTELECSFPDPLPDDLRKKYGLCDLDYAYREIHLPTSAQNLEIARRRLIFDELFFMQTALFTLKDRRDHLSATPINAPDSVKDFISSLPFPLTGAQKRVLREIFIDIKKDNRVL